MSHNVGRWDRIAVQDAILQVLKKAEARFYQGEYKALGKEIAAFKNGGSVYLETLSLPLNPSILIFKPDEIGDAVYAFPAIAALRKALPGAKLTLLCNEKTRALYEASALFDSVIAVKVRTRFLRFQEFDVEELFELTSPFDVAVFLRTYPAYFKEFKKIPARIHVHPVDPRLKSASRYQAFTSLYSRERAHQSTQLLEIISRVTGQKETTNPLVFPKLEWSEADRTHVLELLGSDVNKPTYLVHPYARFETRRYPVQHWQWVITQLQKSFPGNWIVIGGKEDPSLGLPGTLELNGKLSLTQTGALISLCQGFIGTESGPGHLAAAMGKKVVMLFGGHSHLSEWAPVGDALVLKHEVSCQNCYLRACPRYKVRCLTELSPEKVISGVEAYWRQGN